VKAQVGSDFRTLGLRSFRGSVECRAISVPLPLLGPCLLSCPTPGEAAADCCRPSSAGLSDEGRTVRHPKPFRPVACCVSGALLMTQRGLSFLYGLLP